MISDLTESKSSEGVIPDGGEIVVICPPVEGRFYGKVMIEAEGLKYSIYSNCTPDDAGPPKKLTAKIPKEFFGKPYVAKLVVWNDYIAE